VYRDLKPSNVLVDHNGAVKICDFGLVIPVGTVDTSICGTPEYMPPERLSNKRMNSPIDTSVDFWSLGVLAYELIMGYTPYYYEDDNI
jgi:serine/threonine protein kinase